MPSRPSSQTAADLIVSAARIVAEHVVEHERADELSVYPKLTGFLRDAHGLAAMSRAHREIQHLARLLNRIAEGLTPRDIDRYFVRDAQRVIESIEALVRIHKVQEEDIYNASAAA